MRVARGDDVHSFPLYKRVRQRLGHLCAEVVEELRAGQAKVARVEIRHAAQRAERGVHVAQLVSPALAPGKLGEGLAAEHIRVRPRR